MRLGVPAMLPFERGETLVNKPNHGGGRNERWIDVRGIGVTTNDRFFDDVTEADRQILEL